MSISRKVLPLDGTWKLLPDPDNLGKAERWFSAPPETGALEVHVPSVWDRWLPDYDGIGWYFRHFEAEALAPDRMGFLCFEAADYYAEVWLNGQFLGAHEGGYTPFMLDGSDALLAGENLLAVRVVDPHGPDGVPPFHPKEIASAKEGGYFSFAGLWGSVTLEERPRSHVQDIFVRPDIRRKQIAVDVETTAPGVLRLAIEGTPFAAEGEPGTIVVPFPEHTLWAPEEPQRYTLTCSLMDGENAVDTAAVRFGMREFTVKDQRFHLNNRPVFVRAVLHQPDYPLTLAAPVDETMARQELEAAKAAGFNMVRLHIKTAPRITLDLADELGLLVYAEPPIGWIRNSPHLRERCEREVREMILRDRNHPSIVIWGMLNESGNAGYVTEGGAQLVKDGLCQLARQLDPSRLIIDDSGGVNATRERARYMRPYRDVFEAYDDLHVYQRAPVDRYIERYYMNNGDPETLCFLSEFGFGGMEDLAAALEAYGDAAATAKDARFIAGMLEASQRGFAERNLDRVFKSFAEFTTATRVLQCDAIQYQIDAIRANPKMAGYCYTQLCDAGHEFCAGLLDRWRRPKLAAKALKAAQAPVRPLIQAPRTNLVPRQEIPITVLLANDARIEGRADLSLQVVGPTNQVLWKKKRSVKIPKGGKELWTGHIAASGSSGPHRFTVRLMQGMKVLGQNSVALHVFEPVDPCEVAVNVLDPGRTWIERCHRWAVAGTVDAPIHVIPPLANTIRAYPDSDLCQILAQVEDGAVALFFTPPKDWNDLAERLDGTPCATGKDAVGAFLGVYHYAKLHPVFDGLPARGLMRQAYRNVIPAKTFEETSDEDICGAFDTTPIAQGHYMMDRTSWWGSDILVRRYGAGRLVFTHLRILEHLGEDPLAERLWVNLLKHFSRRSVTSGEIQEPDKALVEWLRTEQQRDVRRWMVIGEFPNWGGKGHDTAYPPEQQRDFQATYPGWYRAISWRPWYSRGDEGHEVDLQEALTPIFEYYPRFDYGTAYAYAEFSCDRRGPVQLRVGVQDAMRVWLNGQEVFETKRQVPHDRFDIEHADGYVRQGRNTVLVKVSKIPGPFKFSLQVETPPKEPIEIKWWR